MFRQPEYNPNFSQRLSQVLDDIGVNETTVIKRRRAWMLVETITNNFYQLTDPHKRISKFHFGSQTEGSTTNGLISDIDHLISKNEYRVIQDWSEWEKGNRKQFLMVQDETTFPGYCLMQAVRPDLPLPEVPENAGLHEHFVQDNKGRVLVQHHESCLQYLPSMATRHGPAQTSQYGWTENDMVEAFHCFTWPKESVPWLNQQNASGWPTEDMKRYSVEQGCFIVPVSSRTGVYQNLEWRISTSLAERCLMFNLNITQLKCYILMKMILKTFVKPNCGEAVSSFMCKNILFQSIADSGANDLWTECSLVTRLNQCLRALFNCIVTENCPHFLIPGNNLLAGKLSREVKHRLVEVMCTLTENMEQSLLGIGIDDLGKRLQVKSIGTCLSAHFISAYLIRGGVAHLNISSVFSYLHGTLDLYMNSLSLGNQRIVLDLCKLCHMYSTGPLQQMASGLFTPFLCSIIGSVIASVDIQQSGHLSHDALNWMTLGLNSDISSGKLKMASALYCAGDLERCEILLFSLRRQMEQTTVQSRCECYEYDYSNQGDFIKLCYDNNEHVIKTNLAICAKYLPCEIDSIPSEMKYEMFRSTNLDKQYRARLDFWMNWAVVDALPYLFFLQYKVYRQLHRPADQHRALDNLALTIETEPNLGHRETAWNLLGQCMIQEDRKEEAFYCFMKSLKVRPTNNAAKWHLCMLIASMIAPVQKLPVDH